MRLIGVMAIVLAASCVLSTSASAAEGEILITFSFPLTLTGSATGTSTLEATGSAIIVKCASEEGSLTLMSSTAGTFDALFLGCTAAGAKCTGLADTTSGSILVKGTVEFLAFKNGETLDLAAIFTIEPVHFECLGILTELRGSVIGLVTNQAGNTEELNISLSGSKGKQSITSVNGVEHVLLSETNGGAFVEASATAPNRYKHFPPITISIMF